MTQPFRDNAVELLAQAIWFEHFGIMNIDPRWTEYADRSPGPAAAIRKQAEDMVHFAKDHAYHSLGWLQQ